jgi:VIT1/CCC1 family predicted Fe2+/Mn2+ transporter/rubrerythrin
MMEKLAERERKVVLGTAKEIYAYKLLQAKGYAGLAKKARDERIERLLLEISSNEATDCQYWSKKIEELGGKSEPRARTFFTGIRLSLMMRILGTRGFFEWAIIAEDESVEALAIQAITISDLSTSEIWTRIASDERLHIERMKKEVLGMESWEMGGGGGVRDVVFGANDGLVSILALVAGVYGAATAAHTILIAGVAGAVAGAISMAAGSYLSSKSEREVLDKEGERKGTRRKGNPQEERKQLISIYQSKGFKEGEAEALADRAISAMQMRSELSIGEELGLTAEESWPPIKAGILTGLSFAIVSLIPIIPFTFLSINLAVVTAAVASIATLFAVGASKAIFTRMSWIRSGLEMMIIGALAAVATYIIGLVIAA